MLLLPNNCRCSGTPGDKKKNIPDELPVFPKNWKSSNASVKKYWYIKYRFYDDNLKKNKQIVVKEGINHYRSVKDRQEAVRLMTRHELFHLQDKALNKITNRYFIDADDIRESTGFVDALKFAYKRVKIVNQAILRSCLRYIIVAARHKRYNTIPVSMISQKHIMLLFEQIGEVKKAKAEKRKKAGIKQNGEPWGPNTMNSYRSYLVMLFEILINFEVVKANYFLRLPIQDAGDKIRTTLSPIERSIVNEHLYNHYYSLWRIMQMFFQSGSRETEFMKVRYEDVDLHNRRFKVTIKKGRKSFEDWKPIAEDVFYLWQEQIDNARRGDFLFSDNLMPGKIAYGPEILTKRWYRCVKKKEVRKRIKGTNKIKTEFIDRIFEHEGEQFSIKADFYALKHLYTTEVKSLLGSDAAARRNSHKNTVMVDEVYDVLREERKEDEKKVMAGLIIKFA